MYDVITFGEALIRLSPPNFTRFQQTTKFEVHVGGSELNTAIGLAQLGAKVAWFSRLTDNGLGRLIENTLNRFQVDTSHLIWTDKERIGLYFVEQGRAPRSAHVIYDRAHSSASHMQADELPPTLFESNGAKLLHLTGISLAVGMGEVASEAVRRAKSRGWKISFDLNYRSKLWSIEQARQMCDPLMQQADILFIAVQDAQHVYGLQGDPAEMLAQLTRQCPQTVLVMTLGEQGAAALLPDGQYVQHPAFAAEEVSRIGRGDAVSAGFLFRFLETGDALSALKYGTALAALKFSIAGDYPVFTRAELEKIIGDNTATYFR